MELPRRVALLAITRGGAALTGRLVARWPAWDAYAPERWLALAGPAARPLCASLSAQVADMFGRYDGLVLFAAIGVVVRSIAPCLKDKATDPAVVAVDDIGRHAVSVLAGHRGGANALARAVAEALGAEPVITTASDVRGLPALDLLGQQRGWRLMQPAALTRASAALVNGDRVGWLQESPLDGEASEAPYPLQPFPDLETLAAAGCPAVVVTDRLLPDHLEAAATRWVVYRPPSLVLGVGASTGVEAAEIEALARAALVVGGVAWESLAAVATLDRKLTEPGVAAFAARWGLALEGYSAAALAAAEVPNPSSTVAGFVGTPSVCEAAAVLAARGALLVPKRKGRRATVALARRGGR